MSTITENWENNNEIIVIMNSMEIIEIIKLSNLENDRITNNIVFECMCPRVLHHLNVRIFLQKLRTNVPVRNF